jgi:hypothetical protein
MHIRKNSLQAKVHNTKNANLTKGKAILYMQAIFLHMTEIDTK